jgi:isoleucyl-tRNA synthetase
LSSLRIRQVLSRKKIKPNFKALGAKVGKDMKLVSSAIQSLTIDQISTLESTGELALTGTPYTILLSDVEIIAEDVEGWQVANLGKLTVALDVHITGELKKEGFIKRIDQPVTKFTEGKRSRSNG